MKPTLIYDLDDTLIQTSNVYRQCTLKAMLALQQALAPHTIDPVEVMRLHEDTYFGIIQREGLSPQIDERSWGIAAKLTANSFGETLDPGDYTTIICAAESYRQHHYILMDNAIDVLNRGKQLGYIQILATRGDPDFQQQKVTRCGLRPYFDSVSVFSGSKEELIRRHVALGTTVMIGNSPRADILPAQKAGAHAILVLYHGRRLGWKADDADISGGAYEEADGLLDMFQRVTRLFGQRAIEKVPVSA